MQFQDAATSLKYQCIQMSQSSRLDCAIYLTYVNEPTFVSFG